MHKLARILVVDDEPLNLEIIAEHLDDPNYSLRLFESATEAWAHLQSPASPLYDLILLDRMMPGMDGIQLLRAIKADARFRQTPVIMQTAASGPEQVSEGIAAGAYYYLAKPYSDRELRAIVAAALSWQRLAKTTRASVAAAEGVFEFASLAEARQLAAQLGAHCPDPDVATLGLGELFVNAVEHGNLGISYAEKSRLRLEGTWESEIARRLALPEYRERKARVEVKQRADELVFVISDCGNGFDWHRYLRIDAQRAFDPNGRGIAIARELCFADLQYQGCGNVAVATVRMQIPAPVPANTDDASHASDAPAIAAGANLRVMVVDDTSVNRQILKVFLERLGYRFIGAADGEEALDAFVRERPDVILMDVMMPQVNGYEATQRIRELSGERWVPVIFISALDRNDNLIDGLEAGGDDFMSKPINFIVLDAKLRSLRRMVEMQRRVEAYRERQEREHMLAREILERQMGRPGLCDPCVQHWVEPAQDFSGDIVAATRAADGRLFAMLADGCGHGLAPAISVMPVLSMFYSLVEAAQPPLLPHIVGELNRQLLATLPRGRFVAAAIFCIDQQHRQADLWVGGIPALFWLGADGRVKQRFISDHLSLGIVDTDDDLLTLHRVHWQVGDAFVACSDGLLESQTAGGETLGVDAFVQMLESCPPGADLLSHIQIKLKMRLGSRAPADDISLLVVGCPD